MSDYVWTTTNMPRGKIGQTCPACDTIHAAGEAVAVGRFDPAGVRGYRPRAGGSLMGSRAEAQADLCATRRASETPTLPRFTRSATLREDCEFYGAEEGTA